MATQYSKITPDEFNSARNQVASVLGTTTTGTTGAVQGYGQSVASSAVAQFQKVTESDLDNLRLDIVKSYTHQNGSAPTITNVSKDDKAAASLFNSYTTLATGISSNKNTVAANQLTPVTKIINTETYAAYEGVQGTGGGWKNYANHTITVTFSSADDARYFFNSGSTLVFSASRTGGTVAPTIGLDQNTSWTNLLTTVTNEAPAFGRADFYTLTGSFATWYNKNATGPTYSANYYRISIKSDVANNQYGGATQIQFKIEFVDAYNDGNTTNYDGVDGTFTSTLVEKSPKGVSSGGAITVPKPISYSSSPASGFNEAGTPIYITAAYTVTPSPTSVTENSATINFTFNATNYNTGNTVTFRIIAPPTNTSLNDFVETGWTAGTTLEGYKTLSKTATNTGSYAVSSCSVSIVTNPDTTTEGPETFTIEVVGTADGSGGGFPATETFTITDSSKTPTPGIVVIGPLSSPQVSTIVGEGYTNSVSGNWTVTSTPLTGTASLTLYGIYVDLVNVPSVSGYKITLPGGTEITPGNSYYTFPSPIVLSPSSTYVVTIDIYSNSGPSGAINTAGNCPILKIRSNGGSADGSGPATGPSYNTTSTNIAASIIAATVNFSVTAPTSTTISFAPGATASGTVPITIRNTGNARGILSGYSTVSSSGSLSVSYNNALNGSTIQAGGTLLDNVSVSSSTAGTYYLTSSVTGSNPYAATSNYSRSDIGVTVQQLFPEISAYASNVTAQATYTTGNIYVIVTNIGQAPLTVTKIDVTFPSGGQLTAPTVTQQLTTPKVIAVGGQAQLAFTTRRLRIGTTTFTITVTSDAHTNPTYTTTGTVTGTQCVPTISISSTNGQVTGSSSFTTKAVIKKESNIYVYFDNLQYAGCHPIFPMWEDGTPHGSFSGKPIDAMTNPSYQYCNDYPSYPGTGLHPWKGAGGTEETASWKTGVGTVWIALQTGVYDNGTQSYHQVPGRMGDGVNQSTNQIGVQIEIIPNPKLLVNGGSFAEFVQGDLWSWEIRGCTADSTGYTLGSFTNGIQNITFTRATNSSPTNGSGRYTQNSVSSAEVPVGRYNRWVECDYKGTVYTSTSVTFQCQSPAYVDANSSVIGNYPNYETDLPQLNGYWVTDASNGDIWASPYPATKNWFRRTGAANGSYACTFYMFADDSIEVIVNGVSRGSHQLGNPMTVTASIVNVTDGYVHWCFVVYNGMTAGYFAAVLYLGSPPVTLYGGTTSNMGPSRW